MSDERHDPGRERFDDLKEAYSLGALSEKKSAGRSKTTSGSTQSCARRWTT